jgi:ABC-2 type transport system permease protein
VQVTDVLEPTSPTPPHDRESRAAALADVPLVSPAPTGGIRGILQHRYLLKLLVKREVTARYTGSFLGMLWSYITPLTQFLTYIFIFTLLMGRGDQIEHFAIHVFCAIMVVGLFTETVAAGTRSIVRNSSLLQKSAMPREMFPFASLLVSIYHLWPEFVILGVALFYVGWSPDLTAVAAGVLGYAIIIVFALALGLALSVSQVFLRDTGNIVAVVNNFIRFGVPMMYPYSIVVDRFRGHTDLYLANPIADAVLLVQRCFWVPTTSDPAATATPTTSPDATEVAAMPDHLFTRGLVALAAAVVLLLVAQWIFARFENKMPERL